MTVGLHMFIRTYDMPMFAFISGYFLKKSCDKHGLAENVLKKIDGILLPALLWELFFNLVGGEIKVSANRFWFLYSIFSVSLIVIVIDALAKKSSALKVFLFIVAVILFHTVIIDPNKIGFLLAPCIVGYYFESIKYVLNRFLLKNRKVEQLAKLLILITFITLYCFWKSDYNIWNLGCSVLQNSEFSLSRLLGVVFRFAIGISGILCVKWLLDMLYDCVAICKSELSTEIIHSIVTVGKNTQGLYILQCWTISIAGVRVVNILSRLLGVNLFSENIKLLSYVLAPAVTICSLAVLYYFIIFISKIPVVGKYLFNIPLQKLIIKGKAFW